MLKERINYLCYKKDFIRKKLVHGLIATTHFSNILAGRYPLPEDVAEKIAERLDVEKDYLLKANYIDDDVLAKANDILERLFVFDVDEDFINSFPETNNYFILELIQNLIKGSYYLLMLKYDKAQEIYDNYLSFFLKQFENMDTNIPTPLKKALLYYKMQLSRSENFSANSLNYCIELQSYAYKNPDILMQLKTYQIESLIYTKQYEVVEELLEKAIGYCYFESIFYHLSQLYIMYSGYLHKINFTYKALKYLEKAEESLKYNTIENAHMYSKIIVNNRIIMKMHLKLWTEVENDIMIIERISSNSNENPYLKAQILCYKCELYYQNHNLSELEKALKLLENSTRSIDQDMSLNFYLSIIESSKENDEKFLEYSKIYLPYFEKYRNIERLTDIYKILASQAEIKRQYKIASEYYSKLVNILEKSNFLHA